MQTEKEYLIGKEINALRCESVGEYSLPDYNGDVKKLLAIKTKVFPSGKFVGEDTLELSGTVAYEVVYLDSENNTTHAEFSTDYEAAVKINSETYVDSDVRTSVSGCNVRLVGPRKLSVKSTLDSDVCITESRVHSIDGDAFMEYEPEVQTRVANVFCPTFVSGESREVNEELFSIEGAIRDEVEVLLNDIRFELASLDVDSDSVSVKGDLVLSALVGNADSEPRYVTKKVPCSEQMHVEGAESFDSIDAWMEVSVFKASVAPTDDGVSISAIATLVPKICGKKNAPLSLVTDAYLKERGTQNEYSDFGYTEHICSETKTESFEATRPITEVGIENIGDVIYSEGQAKIDRCEITDGAVQMHGEIRFSGIMCQTVDEAAICSPFKFTLPFDKNVNINCQIHDNMRPNCAVNTTDVKITLDENNVHATANLDLYITLNADKRQRCLGSSYLTDDEYLTDASVVTVYYPDTTESLFSIAEKFHTSVTRIAETNKLTESVFASASDPIGTHGIKKLLIK